MKIMHPENLCGVFTFLVDNAVRSDYGTPISMSIVEYLNYVKFSGYCEYYAGNPRLPPRMYLDLYVVVLGLRFENKKTPKHQFWKESRNYLRNTIPSFDKGISMKYFELSTIGTIRSQFWLRGIVELKDGSITNILEDEDSQFLCVMKNSKYYNPKNVL